MKLGARLRALILSLILACFGALVVSQPAQAAVSTKICYSSDSTDHHSIRVYPTIGWGSWSYTVQYGNCGPWLSNTDNQLRVNVCPEGNSFSYYQIKSDSGYGPKHYGCNTSSDPPNYNGNVYYKVMN